MPRVRMAEPRDWSKLEEHRARHMMESGRDGDFIFTPVEVAVPETLDRAREEREVKAWMKPVTECGWQRTWILEDGEAIFGDLVLEQRPPISSHLHRATLMMGIERTHRGRGFGSEFMKQAISWATLQPTLDWLQLFVFSENLPAQALYRRFGFKENGRVEDMFRVGGVAVTDISMALKLRNF